MAIAQPLFVQSRKAAALLDMKEREFLDLVKVGSLPKPVRFGRWDTEALSAIMRGDPIKKREELDL